jgi:isocitrate dehydrogenase kinase/phosphatase
MLDIKFDEKTVEIYKKLFKNYKPLDVAKKIFNDCNAKIMPVCRITGDKRYVIITNVGSKCFIAIFKVVDKKYYNVLGINTCKKVPLKAISALDFDKLFHKRLDIGKYIDISSQKTVDNFEKALLKKVVKLELNEQEYKDLERLAKSYGSINEVATKLVTDKLKERFELKK